MRKPRILFVTMPDSVHAARWIRQLDGLGWDLHLFPVNAGRPHVLLPASVTVHRLLRDVWRRILRIEANLPMHVWGMWRVRRFLDRERPAVGDQFAEPNLFPVTVRQARRLAAVIRSVRPDVIHSLMITNAGYLTLAARRILGTGRFPKWIVQNWGSDIQLFGRLPEHRETIREVLHGCDFYDCECERDVRLATEFGFRGAALPVRPNGGGYDLETAEQVRSTGPSSSRRTILVKGYQGWAGRALVALKALGMCAEVIKGYRIRVYTAQTADMVLAGRLFAAKTGIQVEFLPPCSHDEMLRRHGEARMSVGLSIGDAISTSMLEAMVMGSLPVQSNTSAWNEWVEDGKTALIAEPEDPCSVAQAIRRAVTDDRLVDEAAKLNWETAKARLDERMIRSVVVKMYEDILLERVSAKRVKR